MHGTTSSRDAGQIEHQCAESARAEERRGLPSGEALAIRYARSGSARVREETILEYRNLVQILASKMARRGAQVEDLVQVGTIGLIQALDRYNPDLGVKFTTYAVNTIVGEMKHYFRDCTWLVKVPRQLQEIAGRVRRTNESILRERGQPPTVSELARRLELSEEAIVEALEVDAVHVPYSLDSPLGGSTDQQERLGEVLGHRDPQLDRLVDAAPLRTALGRLTPRKRSILWLRYYDGCSQTEVGAALGISQMQVSRLERDALHEMRAALTGENSTPAGRVRPGPRSD